MGGRKMGGASQFRRFRAFLTAPPLEREPRHTPIFDRFCIAFLAIDWIVFGAMHFSHREETVQMLPGWVPVPDAVVALTGVAEVTVGILLFYRRARRIAAVGSLLLLVLLIPAVIHILGENQALQSANPIGSGSALFRTLLVPHNVFMAICSVHVLSKPYPAPWTAWNAGLPAGQRLPAGRGGVSALVATILLLCNAAGFLAVLGGVHGDVPTAAMWMMMCLAVGGLLGFLFAVPRSNTKASNRELFLPNRNIEALSDWLTKIIVGLALVNFKDIGAFLSKNSLELSQVLKVDPNFSLSLIIYFFVAGFLEGYLITRIFLQWHFMESMQIQNLGAQEKEL